MNWKTRVEILYLMAATISAVGTALAAGFAAFVYRRNSVLERAKWASTLYEKFYEATTLKQMRDRLDCLNDLNSVNEIVIREEPAFTDYLNFFEFIAFENVDAAQRLRDEVLSVILDCLNRHERVKHYISNFENGYEGLGKTTDVEGMSEHLFLYGTLLPGKAPEEIAPIIKRFRRLGPGHVRGRLYDFGEFPGAVLDPSSRTIVHGELVVLPSDGRILEALDRYEEFDPADSNGSLFIPKKVKVWMVNGSSREGWIYVYNRHPGTAKLVRGGDYLRSKVA